MLKDFLEGKPIRHPLHPLLVHLPIGLFFLSFVLDVASLISPAAPNLVREAFYAMVVGVVTALIAAVPGFVDYTDIRADHPAKRIATAHLTLNLIVVGMYGINIGVRSQALSETQIPFGPFILSVAALVLLAVSGYLGGRLVYAEGIGVGRHRRRTSTPQNTIHLQRSGTGDLVPVPEAERLGDRETLRAEIDGQIIALVRIDNQIYAFQEFCTHRFGPLSEGKIDGFDVVCPWHYSCFDVRTGKVTNGPAKVDLKTFKIETRDGRIYIVIPRPEKSHDQKT